jgi:hypothetical protein
VRYWHGGAPGLSVGDLVVPGERHYVDGCEVCESKKRGESYRLANGAAVDPINAHENRVYITADREYARFYASKYPRGDLYTVEPVGEMEASTEDPFPTWHVGAARVVSVYDTYVRLTDRQRMTLQRRWRRADLGGVWV